MNDMAKIDRLQTLIGRLKYVGLTSTDIYALKDDQYPELSVASYNKNPAALNEPDGIVAVWNLHLLERPEFIFHSQVSLELHLCGRHANDHLSLMFSL